MRELPNAVFPDVMHHGTTEPAPLLGPCRPAIESERWQRVPWPAYDADFEVRRWSVANIVWEGIGLRDRQGVPDWAHGIRTFDQLARRVGFLFVTDRPGIRRAESTYGPVVDIDMTAPQILDAVEDPNVATHVGYILLIEAGAPLPLLHRAAVEARVRAMAQPAT